MIQTDLESHIVVGYAARALEIRENGDIIMALNFMNYGWELFAFSDSKNKIDWQINFGRTSESEVPFPHTSCMSKDDDLEMYIGGLVGVHGNATFNVSDSSGVYSL